MTLAALHWSQLRNMARSPAHYKHALVHGVPETAAMRFGALVHKLALGGTREIVRWGGNARRGKEWEQFRDARPGSTIVTSIEWAEAEAVAASVLAHPIMEAGGVKERTLRWTIADRYCEGTPDILGADLLDLKTTTNSNPSWFQWHAIRMGYLAQLAWYWDGIEQVAGTPPNRALLLAVEKNAPYCVTAFELTERALEMGRKTYRLLFERLMVCEATNEWPGYAQDLVLLDAPDEALTLEVEGETLEIGT